MYVTLRFNGYFAPTAERKSSDFRFIYFGDKKREIRIYLSGQKWYVCNTSNIRLLNWYVMEFLLRKMYDLGAG